MTFAVDAAHLARPAPKTGGMSVSERLGYGSAGLGVVESVEFSVVKRAAIAMFTIKDKLFYSRVRFLVPWAIFDGIDAKSRRFLCRRTKVLAARSPDV